MINDEKKYDDLIRTLKSLQQVKASPNFEADLKRRLNAEKNAKQFKQMFGKNFIEVVNDDDLASLDTKVNKLFGKMMTWASKFPTNDKAQEWKQAELTKKKR